MAACWWPGKKAAPSLPRDCKYSVRAAAPPTMTAGAMPAGRRQLYHKHIAQLPRRRLHAARYGKIEGPVAAQWRVAAPRPEQTRNRRGSSYLLPVGLVGTPDAMLQDAQGGALCHLFHGDA